MLFSERPKCFCCSLSLALNHFSAQLLNIEELFSVPATSQVTSYRLNVHQKYSTDAEWTSDVVLRALKCQLSECRLKCTAHKTSISLEHARFGKLVFVEKR